MAKGLHKYTVQEANNAKAGQGGFDVVPEHDSTVQTPGHSGHWIALQCVAKTAPVTDYTSASAAGLMVRITAAVTDIGDDLGATFMQPGDVIYGNFISVVNHTDSTAMLIAYRG